MKAIIKKLNSYYAGYATKEESNTDVYLVSFHYSKNETQKVIWVYDSKVEDNQNRTFICEVKTKEGIRFLYEASI